jgi:hypothetical protein
VVEVDIDEDEYINRVHRSLCQDWSPEIADKYARTSCKLFIDWAWELDNNSVIEKRGETFNLRYQEMGGLFLGDGHAENEVTKENRKEKRMKYLEDQMFPLCTCFEMIGVHTIYNQITTDEIIDMVKKETGVTISSLEARNAFQEYHSEIFMTSIFDADKFLPSIKKFLYRKF